MVITSIKKTCDCQQGNILTNILLDGLLIYYLKKKKKTIRYYKTKEFVFRRNLKTIAFFIMTM